MSIKDDFIYLNTTKKLLKNEINRVNNVLDDNSTFRSYPQELFNGYLDILNNGTDTLYTNLEKVSQIGTEAVLENVENAPMKIELSGNITQETTSGKNIFNIIDYSNIVIGGSGSASNINKTSNIISFTSSSESASSGVYISNSRLSSYIDDYNSETIYHVSADITTDVACNFKIGTNNSSYVSIPVGTTRLSNSIQASSLVFYVNAVVANIKISNIMISTNQDTSYEPYTNGPSPNPDYPQQVKVVTGENVVSVSGKNLFDKENTTWYRNNDARFFWENNANTIRIRTNSFKIEGGKTYVVSGLPSGISLTAVRTYEDDTPTGVSTGDVTRNGTVFTLGQNVKYIHLLFGGENFTDDTNVMMKNANIQLEEGSTATEYQAFSKADYPIDLNAKNLFDKDNANVLNAWINANTKAITASGSNRTIWVEAESNKTYKVKKIADTSSNGRFRVGSSPNPPVVGGTLAQAIQDDTAGEITITTGANDNYIAVFCYNTSSSITLEEILASLEIEEANASYKEMCKIDDNKDYLFKRNGKWFIHKAIGKVTDQKGSTGITIVDMVADTKVYSYYGGTVNGTTITYNSAISDTNYIYYLLATPTEEEITNTNLIEQLEAISKAKSVKEKTYVTQTNDELPFVLDIQAIKEYNVD